MKKAIIGISLALFLPLSTGYAELPKMTVITADGKRIEGMHTGTWDGRNMLYDGKWHEVYRFKDYGR